MDIEGEIVSYLLLMGKEQRNKSINFIISIADLALEIVAKVRMLEQSKVEQS